MDGKTVRRPFDRRRARNPLHLVGAFATRGGLALAQRRVLLENGKGGEMGVLPEVLGDLDLRSALVSLDAGTCHSRPATVITERGGEDLITLNSNFPGLLHGAMRNWLAARAFAPHGGERPCADAMRSATDD